VDPPDQVGGDFDLGIPQNRIQLIGQHTRRQFEATGPVQVANHRPAEDQGATRPAGQSVAVLQQHAGDPCPHCSHAHDAYADGRPVRTVSGGHGGGELREEWAVIRMAANHPRSVYRKAGTGPLATCPALPMVAGLTRINEVWLPPGGP
jgi:hypothetical protein